MLHSSTVRKPASAGKSLGGDGLADMHQASVFVQSSSTEFDLHFNLNRILKRGVKILISPKAQATIDKMSRALSHNGAVVIDSELEFLTAIEWDELEELGLRNGLPYETVLIGDAGEPNKVEVGRLMTDVDRPRVVNEAISEKMLKH